MVLHRRHNLAASRRRPEDEGEDDGAPDAAELDEDSLSEASALSELDDDEAEPDGSEISEQDEPDPKTPATASATAPAAKPHANGHVKSSDGPAIVASAADGLVADTDTEAMRNGLAMPAEADAADEVPFEEMAAESSSPPPMSPAPAAADRPGSTGGPEAAQERRRREQEEYRKRRDADPTFVPNRGGFFMHDHRHAGPAANGFRPFGRGRGRGRANAAGPGLAGDAATQTAGPADAPWSHDLHETVAPPLASSTTTEAAGGVRGGADSSSGPAAAAPSAGLRSFSKSTHIGNVQMRVYLSGMAAPITFAAVPVKQHTRLPNHRPPLRRDKAVRVSLPDAPPRYIFPAVERSFIFIPRALRPNQQHHGRHGARAGLGSYRGSSSRRTSVYNGSAYSPSVAMSRRSSLAHELSRDAVLSPTGSTRSRVGGAPDAMRPVVRLPPSGQQPMAGPAPAGPASMRPLVPAPVVNLPRRPAAYPAPQDPTYRENRAGPLPMHQPRPQKTVSVAGIESPESAVFAPPRPQAQQPFHQQVPGAAAGLPTYGFDPAMMAQAQGQPHGHVRQPSYPSQPSSGTPLSQIPERAIHAQPFQPQPYQAAYYASPYPNMLAAGPYYYAGPAAAASPYPNAMAGSASAGAAPVAAFVGNGAPATYMMPLGPGPGPGPGPAPMAGQVAGQASMVAQESNGMVYYYDPSQLTTSTNAGPAMAQPAPSGPAGVVMGMGGMMTPSPDGYYYPQAPPPPPAAMYYGP